MKSKRFLVNCLIGFVIFLLVITYFSRTVYAWTLPRVELGFSEKTSFRIYTVMNGVVELSDEYEGYTAVTEFFIPRDVIQVEFTSDWMDKEFWLRIPAYPGGQFEGKVIAVRTEPEGIYITLGYTSPYEVVGGESVVSTFDHTSKILDFVIPDSAIHEDFEGKYILRVAERNTAMGRQFVLVRETAYPGPSIRGKTALINEDTSGAPIVFYADRELEPGMAVRFYP